MASKVIALLLALAPWTARADDYTDALAAARRAAQEGHPAEAARLLDEPARRWPQDLPLQLERAYDLLRAGEYERAAEGYRAALALEPGSGEARRGLDDARLRRGARDQVWLGVFGGATLTSGLAGRPAVGLGVVSLDAVVDDRWALSGLYRAFAWSAGGAAGMPARGGRGASLSLGTQHEAHLGVGWSTPRWGVGAQLAAIGEATGTGGVVLGHQGAGGALSAFLVAGLEWRAAAAAVRYDDVDALQLEAGATLPIGSRLALGLGGRAQRVGGRSLSAGLASVELRGPWHLRLSGEAGTQYRLTDVAGQSLYDGDDDLRLAVRARADVPLHGPVRAWAAWDLEGWRTPASPGPAVDYVVQRFTAGLVFTW